MPVAGCRPPQTDQNGSRSAQQTSRQGDTMPYERTPEIRDKARQKAIGRVMSAETKAKIAETLRQRNAKDKAEKAMRDGTPLQAFPFELVIIETAPEPAPIYIEFPAEPLPPPPQGGLVPPPDPNAWVGFESEDEAPPHSYWGV